MPLNETPHENFLRTPLLRTVTKGGIGGFSPLDKCFGHSIKKLVPPQKIIRSPWYLKLVTGVVISTLII